MPKLTELKMTGLDLPPVDAKSKSAIFRLLLKWLLWVIVFLVFGVVGFVSGLALMGLVSQYVDDRFHITHGYVLNDFQLGWLGVGFGLALIIFGIFLNLRRHNFLALIWYGFGAGVTLGSRFFTLLAQAFGC